MPPRVLLPAPSAPSLKPLPLLEQAGHVPQRVLNVLPQAVGILEEETGGVQGKGGQGLSQSGICRRKGWGPGILAGGGGSWESGLGFREGGGWASRRRGPRKELAGRWRCVFQFVSPFLCLIFCWKCGR